jgi:hypothetical protein
MIRSCHLEWAVRKSAPLMMSNNARLSTRFFGQDQSGPRGPAEDSHDKY